MCRRRRRRRRRRLLFLLLCVSLEFILIIIVIVVVSLADAGTAEEISLRRKKKVQFCLRFCCKARQAKNARHLMHTLLVQRFESNMRPDTSQMLVWAQQPPPPSTNTVAVA